MSRALVDLGLCLRAQRERRPVDASTRRLVDVRDDALLLSLVAMPGDMGSMWAFGIGTLTKPVGTVKATGDPRSFDVQRRMLGDLGVALRRHWRTWAKAGACPQVIVASRSALRLIETVVFRWANSSDLDDDQRKAVALLSFVAERGEYAGSRAVVVCTSALADRWAVGVEPDDADLLVSHLDWHGDDGPTLDRYDEPDVGLSDEDESTIVTPLSTLMSKGSASDSASVLTLGLSKPVTKVIDSIAKIRLERIAQAARLLREDPAPPLPGADDLWADDVAEWKWKVSGFDQGYRLGPSSSPKASAVTLARREEALDRWASLRLWGCEIELRRATAEGRVLIGTIADSDLSGVTIETPERTLRIRPGTELAWRDDPRIALEVDALIDRGADGTVVEARWTAGMRVGLPAVGTDVVFCDKPDQPRSYPIDRVRDTPWTHDPDLTPTGAGRSVSADPLADARALRADQ